MTLCDWETSSAPFVAEQRMEILSFWKRMNVEGNSYPRSHVYKLRKVNKRGRDGRRRQDLECGSFSDGFILPSSEEDAISVGNCAVLIVFASFLIDARQLLQQGKRRRTHSP
jgi:hypothetical protein